MYTYNKRNFSQFSWDLEKLKIYFLIYLTFFNCKTYLVLSPLELIKHSLLIK